MSDGDLVMTIVINRQTGMMTPVGNLGTTGALLEDILTMLDAFDHVGKALRGQLANGLRPLPSAEMTPPTPTPST